MEKLWSTVEDTGIWQAWTERAVGPLHDIRQVSPHLWASNSFSLKLGISWSPWGLNKPLCVLSQVLLRLQKLQGRWCPPWQLGWLQNNAYNLDAPSHFASRFPRTTFIASSGPRNPQIPCSFHILVTTSPWHQADSFPRLEIGNVKTLLQIPRKSPGWTRWPGGPLAAASCSRRWSYGRGQNRGPCPRKLADPMSLRTSTLELEASLESGEG